MTCLRSRFIESDKLEMNPVKDFASGKVWKGARCSGTCSTRTDTERIPKKDSLIFLC